MDDLTEETLVFQRIADFHEWFAERRAASACSVTRARLDQLDGWHIQQGTGTIQHHSGKFFAVDGLEISTDHASVSSWTQPIIIQPESGILGILVKRFHGVPHFLMQAKVEPGNIGLLQLSPTVQATRSNYTRVHKGKAVPYLEYFQAPRRGRILSDVLQSEQGSWFLHKRNRNMIIEITDDVEVLEDFCWLTAAQLGELLRWDHVVNMDSRTVLAGWPLAETHWGRDAAIDRDQLSELLSWFTEAKSRYQLTRQRIPLTNVKNWIISPERIVHENDAYFAIVGVDVKGAGREVAGWSQPMIEPRHPGVVAFVTRHDGDEPRVLVHAHTQAGTHDVVEMAPTVQCAPGNYEDTPPDRRPSFLDYVLSAGRERVLFDALHSEEGGRFYQAENRYLVVEAGPDLPEETGPDFAWMTLSQLAELARYGNYVNVEARNLLACLLFT
ncbi:NDP-hexose 2,3-dehydratase family protein [Lentzea sp. BCCO 10_0798]|uniref:NDP-hexose 2,3-dehydratase family protein n=1 Tax=Lentzea kristufekii TaxID=3095430 RepID=A0ABU4TYE6_9PSEU|nr:NDP-hexose 2,3-dehydratase family protein [Lentzea sp. BCCO 10_0798]MDX8053054.1 NDP-hexose 2,3-dehydratase family protein [Lentzea sp. BCCO 10_0798]